MKIYIQIILSIIFLWNSYAYGQNNTLDSKAIGPISKTLSNYDIGSGISLIVFEKKRQKINIISIVSSNTKSKALLDSLFSLVGNEVYFSELKKGNYCLPLIQTAYLRDETMNWANNNISSWTYPFHKQLVLPENTFILRPIVIFVTDHIQN